MASRRGLHPFFWTSIFLVLAQILTLVLVVEEKQYLEENQIPTPELDLGPVVLYFLGAVVVIGLVLFLVPKNMLRILLKIIFAALYAWGAFIALTFFIDYRAAIIIAGAMGLLWLFQPRVWFHNLLLLVAMAGIGSVFGVQLSPWTGMIFMLIIAIYDVVAVRSGYMMWMAKRMFQVETPPAFIIPHQAGGWNTNLSKLKLSEEASERDISILGGGDIGFPLILSASVYFAYGLVSAMIVGGFSILGLAGAYLVQRYILKGKPVPALPPIAIACLIGLTIAYFVL